MPREAKPPRLYLRKDKRTGSEYWIILHRGKHIRTGCRKRDVRQAEARLAEYITRSYRPSIGSTDPHEVKICDVLMAYAEAKSNTVSDQAALMSRLKHLNNWWRDKPVSSVIGPACRAYVDARTTPQSARRELEDLRSAINLYNREYGLTSVPKITLPPKAEPRQIWLTRQQVSRMIWAARRAGNHHLARYILIGIYTGTRKSAILGLQWMPNTLSGYVELDKGVMYRSGIRETVAKNKQRPPVRLNRKLLGHMKRWQRQDGNIRHIVHYGGERIVSNFRRSWERMLLDAGIEGHVTPHSLRHTAATWLMQAGVPINKAAGFLGMTVQTLERVYGHHHPHFQEEVANAF